MIHPIILKSETILLRPFEKMDIDAHYEAAVESVDTIYPWLPWCHTGYKRIESKVWVDSRQKEWDQGVSYDFVITDTLDGSFLGACALNCVSREKVFSNLGYWVRASRTRRGIATEASRLLIDFGFSMLRLKRIEISIAAGNGPSIRVAEKLGAVKEGVLRNRMVTAFGISDAVMYSIIPEDLLAKGTPSG
jgi:RimJ/RimL family protein N-acetyltransferase